MFIIKAVNRRNEGVVSDTATGMRMVSDIYPVTRNELLLSTIIIIYL